MLASAEFVEASDGVTSSMIDNLSSSTFSLRIPLFASTNEPKKKRVYGGEEAMGHAVHVLKKNSIIGVANREGFPAFRRDWREEYLQMLLTNTVSRVFYASERELGEKALEMHRFAADEDPEFMARALAYARNEGFMRFQPLLGLAMLSLVAPRIFSGLFDQVIRTVADLAEFTLALEALERGQGGRLVKKLAALRLLRLTEYEALKYGGEGRGFSLRDLLRVYHPKPLDAKTRALFRYIAEKVLSPEERNMLPSIDAFLKVRDHGGSEGLGSVLEWIREGRLPYNIVTGAVGRMTSDLWEALLPDLPLFALVRHLSTLQRNGVFDEEKNRSFVVERLSDAKAVRAAKILPFRFASAWKKVRDVEWLRHALERALELAVDLLPSIEGKTAILLDVSGSMSAVRDNMEDPLTAGAVLALSIMRKAGGKGIFFLFDTEATLFETSPEEPILAAVARIDLGGGTDTGVALKSMLQKSFFVDNIVIVTDEQQNEGSPFFEVLRKYREKINGNAKAFVVNVAPYGGAMIPPEDENTFYVYGWSDHIVSFIANAVEGHGNIAEKIAGLRTGGID